MIVLSLPKEDQSYTYADYLSWPEEERVEILGGRPYLQAAPSRIHQRVLSEIHRQIANYLLEREWEAYPAPSQELWDREEEYEKETDRKNVLEPEITITGNMKK